MSKPRVDATNDTDIR